jgi:hypothetical protein
MRPSRPHAVVTTEHSVFEGGHFYSWSTMRETCFGIFNTLPASRYLTNGRHESLHDWQSRELLRRIVTYFHMHFVEGVSQAGKYHFRPNTVSVIEIFSTLRPSTPYSQLD